MYESPIQLMMNDMYKQIQVEQEITVYKAIQSIGVNVDKDKLIKALKYDREQYNKGYADGIKEFADMLKEKQKEYEYYLGCYIKYVSVDDIDNLIDVLITKLK